MPLVNMKLSKKEAKADSETSIIDSPRYPWGLSINLDEESLTKLGVKELPKTGDSKMVVAYVDVTETHESDSIDGKKRRNIRLQITDMSIEEKASKDVLKKLYGDSKK